MKEKSSAKNLAKNRDDNRQRKIIFEDDEEHEEFLQKYHLFKEKYLLKESLKPARKTTKKWKNILKIKKKIVLNINLLLIIYLKSLH